MHEKEMEYILNFLIYNQMKISNKDSFCGLLMLKSTILIILDRIMNGAFLV